MWRTIALYKRLSSESVVIIVISVVLVIVSSIGKIQCWLGVAELK